MTVSKEADRLLGYRFRNHGFLEEALTHRSHLQGKSSRADKDNERLEFLGDAVLGLLVSEYLAETFPRLAEGDLSHVRARLIGRASLAEAARRLGLGQLLRLGLGEERTQGREKSSLLANALEAVIAAIYLDGGLASARTFVLKLFQPQLRGLHQDTVAAFRQDYKSQLQEWCQRHGRGLPAYAVMEESGPGHRKAFAVRVSIDQTLYGRGEGRSKKVAEQQAAQRALEQIQGPTDALTWYNVQRSQ